MWQGFKSNINILLICVCVCVYGVIMVFENLLQNCVSLDYAVLCIASHLTLLSSSRFSHTFVQMPMAHIRYMQFTVFAH